MKYQQIKKQLLLEMREAGLEEGQALPGENALAERFGVSRMTARRALSDLQDEGYLVRIPGKGNFLRKPVVTQGFFKIRPFREYARNLGAEPSTCVLFAGLVKPPDRVSQALGLGPGAKVVLVHRLRGLDGEPVMEEKRYLRADLCATLLEEDLEAGSIHELLIERLKLPLTKVWQRLQAVVLEGEAARHLGQLPGSPAFRLERITYTYDAPVTWVQYLMCGARYLFEETFSP
ncbi:MAG: GntR family transcriptional regulator [Acidobacteria bacterium]|nr:GntR family transcriptional regulator [Acidobacteriota bacterium]MCB9397757.1 GntR family transcriptional regulator [Acidobacteriota bacterium]